MKNFLISLLTAACTILFYHVVTFKDDPFIQAREVAKKQTWMYNPKFGAICTAFHIGDGLLLTAAHCADIQSKDQSEGDAGLITKGSRVEFVDVVAVDKDNDIALLRANISGPGLKTVDDVNVDQQLYAVGIPGKLDHSVVILPTRINIFNYLGGTSLHSIGDAIWPGMSGGPLIDENGNVYGLISYTQTFIMGRGDMPVVRDMGGYAAKLDSWVRYNIQEKMSIVGREKDPTLPLW